MKSSGKVSHLHHVDTAELRRQRRWRRVGQLDEVLQQQGQLRGRGAHRNARAQLDQVSTQHLSNLFGAGDRLSRLPRRARIIVETR